MRNVVILIFLLVATAFRSGQGTLVHRLIVQPESQITIDGKSNVNTFTCRIKQYIGNDTLVLHEGGQNNRPVFVKGSVSLNASGFDCGSAMMTSDFAKTIGSKLYPEIIIDFISFERTPSYGYAEEKFKGIIKISLGGTTKLFEMDCTIEALPTGLIHLKGGREFRFSDFNLIPPKKMMGMVKVRQELVVKFHLVLRLNTQS